MTEIIYRQKPVAGGSGVIPKVGSAPKKSSQPTQIPQEPLSGHLRFGATAGSVPLPALKAYSGIRFGAAQSHQGFDLQKFMAKEIGGGLEDVWTQAVENAKGKDVNPEDFLHAMVRDFAADLAAYSQSENKLQYFAFSYFGKALGMSNSLHFLKEKTKEIQQIQELGEILEARLALEAVEAESRSMAPSDRSKAFFQASKELLATILTQAPEKLQTALVTEDLLLQILAKQDRGLAGEVARKIFEEVRLRPATPIDDFLSDTEKAENVKETDARKPSDLSALVAKSTFSPYPGVQEDLKEAAQVLERNRARHLMLQVPKNLNSERVVETLVHQMGATGESPKFFRINALKYFAGGTVAQGIDKLQEALKELVRDNGNVTLHLQGMEEILRQIQADSIPTLFEHLSQGGKIQFILTPPESQLNPPPASPLQPQVAPLANLLNGFSTVSVEVPKAANTIDFLKNKYLKGLSEKYPNVTFSEEALRKAVDMAQLTKDQLIETAFEYLAAAAQRFPNGTLTADRVNRAVKEDPHLQYTTKSATSATYQRLGETEIGFMLENTPEIIGSDAAKNFFDRLVKGIQDPGRFKEFGLTPITRAVIVGQSGTAKTALALKFAKENKIPVVLVSGTKMAGLPPAQIGSILQQAFLSAKNESKRKEAKGESPYVMVLVDNLEAATRPLPNDPMGRLENPLLEPFIHELSKLKQEENQFLLTVGVANASTGLHPAFQSPSVLDELVRVDHPNLQEREAILKSLSAQTEAKAGKKFYAADLDFNKAARRLSGVTGKILEMVLTKAREKAMMDKDTAKNPGNLVQNRHLDEAITTLTLGTENRKLYNILSPDDRRATAYHEGGHALTFQKMKEYLGQTALELLKVTIMPQGPALGVTFYVPEADFHTQTKTQLFAQLVSVVASLPAEQLSLQDVTTGNSNDRQVATQIAAMMVNQVAMGKNKIAYPIESLKDISSLPAEVRQEMSFFISQAEKIAEVIIRGYAPFMETLVDRLAGPDGQGGEETIQAEEFKRMLAEFEQKNPKSAQSVRQMVKKLMTPVFPERFPQGAWSQLMDRWFGVTDKPVFRETERLNKKKAPTKPDKTQ